MILILQAVFKRDHFTVKAVGLGLGLALTFFISQYKHIVDTSKERLNPYHHDHHQPPISAQYDHDHHQDQVDGVRGLHGTKEHVL